jgi:hypothetical protein
MSGLRSFGSGHWIRDGMLAPPRLEAHPAEDWTGFPQCAAWTIEP